MITRFISVTNDDRSGSHSRSKDKRAITMKEEREKKKKKRKSPWRHIEALITTLLIPLKKYQRNESSNTKEGHR